MSTPLVEIENDTPVVKKEKAVKPPKPVVMTKRKPFYLTNADLLKEVVHAKGLGKITDKLARMFILLTERYSRKSNFAGYSFREDMVSTALINLCANGLKFNPEKSSNPFAFYTTAIHHSFLQYMADEKKHRNIRDGLIVAAGSNPSFAFADADSAPVERNPNDPLSAGVGELVTGRRSARLPGECVTTHFGEIEDTPEDEVLVELLNEEGDGVPDDEITEGIVADLQDLLVFDDE